MRKLIKTTNEIMNETKEFKCKTCNKEISYRNTTRAVDQYGTYFPCLFCGGDSGLTIKQVQDRERELGITK